MKRSAVLLAAVGLLVAAGVALTLSQSETRMAGSNLVPLVEFADVVPAGRTICQRGQTVPFDTAAFRFLVGSFGKPMPRIDVQVRDARGAVLDRATLPAGAPEGETTIPLGHALDEVPKATLCVRGQSTRIALAGVASDSAVAARVGRRPQPGIFRIEYMRPGRPSWWSMFPEISRRFGYAKASVIGTWTLPVLILLALVIYGLVGALLWRVVSPR